MQYNLYLYSLLLSILIHANIFAQSIDHKDNHKRQTITGLILDSLGAPLPNALVSHTNDWNIWAKTDINGTFSIQGNSGTLLKVAALHHQTTDVLAGLFSTSDLKMQRDVILNTDEYHISFDHLRPGDFYSKDEFKNDFPVPSGAGFYESNDASSNRAYVDAAISRDNNGRSLRVRYPAHQLKTANSGVDSRIPLTKTYKNNDYNGEELYLSYWVKFSDNYQFEKCGGKLPSLGGSDLGVRQNEWKGRIMMRKGGSIQFYMELPHKEDKFEHDSLRFWGEKTHDGGNICSNEFTSYLNDNKWHNIELHYKLDDGTPIGLFEGWVDGNKGHKIINSEVFGFYRRKGEGLENLTTNAILLSTFLGGSSLDYEPDEDLFAWFDEFRVSKNRINEFHQYDPLITSISESVQSNKQDISIHPNPSYGLFNLSLSTSWKVMSIFGSEVLQGTGKVVDLSNKQKGIYFLITNKTVTKLVLLK